MSKRTKRKKMFRKQQEITEGSDDDQEMIIPPHRDSTSSSSCASGEMSDDSHGQMIVTSATSGTTTKPGLITVTDEYDLMNVADKNVAMSEHINDSYTGDDEVDGVKGFNGETSSSGQSEHVIYAIIIFFIFF